MTRSRQRRRRGRGQARGDAAEPPADGMTAMDDAAAAETVQDDLEQEGAGDGGAETAGAELPARGEDEDPLVARTTTHFLPKFDNQNEDKRLGWLISGAEAEAALAEAEEGAANILYVSKKHSGSLVMAPPFYSKNGTGNEFSRVGCVLLYEYFLAVWPGEGADKFKAWWDDAEQRGICYSFECVAPRILGDHGATPRCAYMVLTCAAVTREERFMSPSELLQVATEWRLPLNEVWLIPGARAHEVEKELHARRWEMEDRDASAVLDKHLPAGQEAQRFLSHAETQGQVLEGFVLMALQANPERLAALVKTYNETMRPFHDAALAAAARLGQTCLDPTEGKAFRASVNKLDVAPLNMPDIYREPARFGKGVAEAAVWDRVCEHTAPGRTQTLFRRLRALYAHSVRLQAYMYADRLQIQVHVRDDEVFYGWPLHMMDQSTAPLFRGMVVTLFSHDEAAAHKEQTPALASPTPVKILGIAKLKCLNYMWRTFGVRNRLFILLKRGKEDFLKTLKKGFYPPWSIPQAHREVLDVFFRKWADFALSLPAKQQDALRTQYLDFLEHFLAGTPYPLGTPRAEVGLHAVVAESTGGSPPAASSSDVAADQLSILVLNLTGLTVSPSKLHALGLDASSNKVLADATQGKSGFYEITTRFPKVDQVKAADALLVLGIDASEPSEVSTLSENQRKAAEGSLRGFTKRAMPRLGANTQTPILMNPPDAQFWVAAVSSADAQRQTGQSAAAPPEAPAKKSQSPAAGKPKPKRLVLCTLALPPGGGKSSLFEAFEQSLKPEGPQVTFCYRSSDDAKSRASFESEFSACVQGRSNKKNHPKGDPIDSAKVLVVGYDKNIPNMDGVRRLLTALKPHAARYDLRVLCIVPEVLDHDAFWKRVQARDAKTHIGLAIGEKLSNKEAYRIFRSAFFQQCEDFQPHAARAPGALVSDIFVRKVKVSGNPLAPLAQMARESIASFAAGCSYADLAEWADTQDLPANESAPGGGNARVAPERGNWCCADVEGHPNLHVTLVPPPPSSSSSAQSASVQRKTTLQALQSVAGRSVKIRATRYHRAVLAESDAAKAPRKRRHDGSFSDAGKHIGFWEVDEIEGLPDALDLGQQQDILHITDRASITRGVRAKQAGQVMRQIKRQRGDLLTSADVAEESEHWVIETETHPLSVTATIAFYR